MRGSIGDHCASELGTICVVASQGLTGGGARIQTRLISSEAVQLATFRKVAEEIGRVDLDVLRAVAVSNVGGVERMDHVKLPTCKNPARPL